MFVCVSGVLTALITLMTTMVSYTKPQDSILSVSLRRIHAVFSTTGFKDGGRVIRRVKPPRSREASYKPCALNWDRT